MTPAILEVRHVKKRFMATQALDDVSLSFHPGVVHAVVGENGAGKSTLMNLIGGVHQPDEGEILLEGTPVRFASPHDAMARGIGFVHQEIALCQHISVAENIHMARVDERRGLRRGLIDFRRLHASASALLARFGAHVDPRARTGDLSVSQQQVVEIVKALSMNCKVMIFDEPTASLNEQEAERLFAIIATLREQGLCILYISHRLAEIFQACDQVSVLRDGRLIDTNPVNAVTQSQLVGRMVGRELADIYPAKSTVPGAPVLEVRGLSSGKRFHDVSFTVRAGEILGFAGLVGSGRTEVARAVCGLLERSAGTVTVAGEPLEPRSYRDAILRGVVYLTEDRKTEGLFLERSLASNISVMDLGAVASRRLIDSRGGGAAGHQVHGRDGHQGGRARGQGRLALRRQPAEGAHLQAPVGVTQGGVHGRAHPRDRHRSQGAHLPHPAGAGGGRGGGDRHQLGAARGGGALRPRGGDERGARVRGARGKRDRRARDHGHGLPGAGRGRGLAARKGGTMDTTAEARVGTARGAGLRRLIGHGKERAMEVIASPGIDEPRAKGGRLRRAMGFREGTTILLVLVIAVAMSFASPYFLTSENITTTVQSFSIDGFVVIAMTIVLISGGIDLSLASVMALSGVLTGVLFRGGLNIWIASLAGLGVGGAVGAVNGFFITRLGLSPFITTLALQQIARGAAYVISGGVPVPLSNMPPEFKFMGRGTLGGTGIPFTIVLFLAAVVLFDFMSRKSIVLRKVYYLGSNEKAARLSGIDVNRVRMGVYVLAGFLASIAGILTISRFNSATSYYGVGVDLKAISACVIGGSSLNGGEGTILGSIIGITLMSVIASALVLLDVSPYWQDLTMGLILLAAVSIDFLSHMRRK